MKADWQRYYEIEKKTKDQMTEEEYNFYKFMYQLEEMRSGLDGEGFDDV